MVVHETVDTDLLILGAGGAGLCAALHAADRSDALSVTVAVKGLLGRAGCTRMVQGGYNAVMTAPDSIEAHALDTLKGGGWINDQALVWTLVTEAPGRVRELEGRYGCFFDRNPEGHIHQKPFAGQTHDRTIHKGDLTGIEIMNRLTEQVWARPGIRVLEEQRAVALLQDGAGRVGGALLLDLRDGRFTVARSRATLLAMGGGPTMYRVFACSADKSADGIALALRAGATLRDMEMIQFHPTGLIIPNSLMTGALLEEGLRGAGGRLLNGQGERFMARHDRERMERSTRDLVARAAFLEVQEGRGTPNGGVWIDVSHLGAERVEREFRGMVRRCRDFGHDLARVPVEVGPTAHFMMGGVVIDCACRTGIEALFAAGEDTGGVHGANRLGGNGVAESTVFGGIAGDRMAESVVGRPQPRLSAAALEEVARRFGTPPGPGGSEDLYALSASCATRCGITPASCATAPACASPSTRSTVSRSGCLTPACRRTRRSTPPGRTGSTSRTSSRSRGSSCGARSSGPRAAAPTSVAIFPPPAPPLRSACGCSVARQSPRCGRSRWRSPACGRRQRPRR